MTLDVSELRERSAQLENEAALLRRIADETERAQGSGSPLAELGLTLPPSILVPDPGAVAGYLRVYPDLVPVVRDMATALVKEFRSEPSEIELTINHDPEFYDPYVKFYVRVARYDRSLMPRLERIARRFDDRRRASGGWVLITTDHKPIS